MGASFATTLLRLAAAGLTVHRRHVAEGHGYLASPRSRNLLAAQETNWASPTRNDPAPENCPQCLNLGGSRARCGMTEGRSYDAPRNAVGGLMRSAAQATYVQGQDITVDVTLTAHHKGHFVFSGCPVRHGEAPSQRCFDENQLAFVRDLKYGARRDPRHPERAYLAPMGATDYSFKMRLPSQLHGDLVLIQWYYLTANSCTHEGYREYDWPWNDRSMVTLPRCERVSDDGSGVPEQFWNCAEVKIERRNNGANVVSKRPENNKYDKKPPPRPPPETRPAKTGASTCSRGRAGYVPTANCAGYVQCDAAGNPAGGPLACPAGTLFDAATSACNHAAQVRCNARPENDKNDKEPPSRGKDTSSSSADTAPPPKPPPKTGPAKVGASPCPRGGAGYEPTANCAGYVQCDVAGNPAGGPIACPGGTLFDVAAGVCNHAAQVQCARTATGEARPGRNRAAGNRQRPANKNKPSKNNPSKKKPSKKKRSSNRRQPGKQERPAKQKRRGRMPRPRKRGEK